MAARELTFDQYVAAEGGGNPPVEFWWSGPRAKSTDLDTGQLITGTGLTEVPPNEIASGYLLTPWNGHPRYALVVTTSIGFRPGARYAVSREAAPPLL